MMLLHTTNTLFSGSKRATGRWGRSLREVGFLIEWFISLGETKAGFALHCNFLPVDLFPLALTFCYPASCQSIPFCSFHSFPSLLLSIPSFFLPQLRCDCSDTHMLHPLKIPGFREDQSASIHGHWLPCRLVPIAHQGLASSSDD